MPEITLANNILFNEADTMLPEISVKVKQLIQDRQIPRGSQSLYVYGRPASVNRAFYLSQPLHDYVEAEIEYETEIDFHIAQNTINSRIPNQIGLHILDRQERPDFCAEFIVKAYEMLEDMPEQTPTVIQPFQPVITIPITGAVTSSNIPTEVEITSPQVLQSVVPTQAINPPSTGVQSGQQRPTTQGLYKDAYRNIHPDVVAKTRELIVTKKVYRQTEENKMIIFKEWLEFVSNFYSIPVPRIRIDFNATHSGWYRHSDLQIELPKFSTVTLFHEFKHHKDISERGTTNEETARGWSVSLFYKMSPNLYENAVAKGLLFFTSRLSGVMIGTWTKQDEWAKVRKGDAQFYKD